MKLGIVGKGGVGKTTVSALLAAAYARRGARVVAIDTDSNPNLGMSLGLSFADTDAVPVLPRALIVGAGGDTSSEDLIRDYGRCTPAGVTLLSAIRVNEAAAGCTCAGHATVRSFLGDVLAEHADVTLVDMEAGLEHLSRSGGTLAYADVLLVVMEPSRKSVITAARTMALADDLGLERVYGLGNKARGQGDIEFFHAAAAEHGVPLAGVLAHHEWVGEADRAAAPVTDAPEEVTRDIDAVVAFLDRAGAKVGAR